MEQKHILGTPGERQKADPNLNAELIKKYSHKPPIRDDSLTEPPTQPPTEPQQIITTADITKSDYIQIPGVVGLYGGSVLISKFEMPGANDKNYEDAHRFVLREGLYIPPPAIFAPHFVNVVTTYRNKTPLFDGDSNPIPRKEHEDIYRHLTTNHIAVYGVKGREGAWAWLNARLIQGTGFKNLNLETVLSLNPDDTLKTRIALLQDHIKGEGIYVDLDFNNQGAPTKKSATQSYQQGINLRFWGPRINAVARFFASSGRAGLGFFGGPEYSGSSLGVFPCAEGATQKF
ncbi:MAG: hypothetical protein ABII03_04960 [Nanoarchaeota archaeon]